MSWFSKKLKKVTKVIDPIGNQLRKSTGGSYGDPMNWYQSKPPTATPYVRPERPGLQADPGTAGPTVDFGGGNPNYTPNPFAQQMAQANALRGGSPQMQQSNMAPAMGAPMTPQMPMAQPQGMQNTMFRGGPRTPNMAF